MAFSAMSGMMIPISDPRYIQWVASLWKYDTANGMPYKIATELLHKCTDDEMLQFFEPVNLRTGQLVEELQNGGFLYCLDWKVF